MVLITGANGQLGHDFQRVFKELKVDYISTDYLDLDITKEEDLRNFVKNKKIDYIINCAAYNNVDKAEEEVEACYALNAEGPKLLASIAKETGAVFVTYSTDFVFDGKKGLPYTEKDSVNPLSIYSQAKVQGEKNVTFSSDG